MGVGVTILIIMPLCGPILQVKTFSKIFNYKLKFSDRAECGKNLVQKLEFEEKKKKSVSPKRK